VLRRRSRCVIRVVRTKTFEILSAHQAWIGGAQSEAGSEENIPAIRNSIARVALFNQDGLVGSRPLSEVKITGFEERINHQLQISSDVSLISDRTNAVMDIHGTVRRPVGRLFVELYSQAVHDGQLGGGSSWT